MPSSFYHDLHINQLTAIAMIDDALINEFRDRWIRYQQNWRNRVKAFGAKAIQKLHDPGEVVIVR